MSILDELSISRKQARSVALANGDASQLQINLWEGAVRSGKTVGSLVKYLMKIADGADLPGENVIIGRTKDTIYRNLIAPMQDQSMYGPWAEHVRYNNGASTANILGQTVHIIGSSDVLAEHVIRGMTIKRSYVDEWTLVKPDFTSQLMARHSVEGAWCGGTTNPDGPRHDLKVNYIDRAAEMGHRIFHFGLEDNRAHLPEGYIENLSRQYTGLWHDRFIKGLWTMADGVIYECFDPARHVVEQMPEIQRIIAMGIDDGVNHPAAGLLIGLGVDNKLYAMAEWAPPSGTPADRTKSLRRFIAEHGKPERFFVDPSAAALKMQMQREGFGVIMNAHNSHKSGIGIVSALLSTDQLLINGALCRNLLEEIGGYVWDRKAAERGEDTPVKEDDDFMDAWRYGVYSSFQFWRNYIPIDIPIDAAEEVAA